MCVCRYREGRPLTAGADFEISYRDGRVRLSIPEVFAEDAGRYLCSAENKAGRSQSSAELVVRGTALPTSSALSILLYKSVSNKCIAVRKVATSLRELTCRIGSHSVTCHPAEVTFPPLPQPKLVLD